MCESEGVSEVCVCVCVRVSDRAGGEKRRSALAVSKVHASADVVCVCVLCVCVVCVCVVCV